MCRRIAVVSGKGGVGKSTVSAGIAYSLSKSGKRVLVVDCDVGADSQKIFFNISEETVFNLGDLMADRCSLRSVIVTPKNCELDIITPPTDFKDTDFLIFFKNIMAELSNLYDYIIIDAPSGMDSGYSLALSGADAALIVTSTDLPSLSFAEKVSADLQERGMPACLVVNKIASRKKRSGTVDLDAIVDNISVRLIGALPNYDPNELKDVNAISDCRAASDAFMRIASRLMGKYVKIGLSADY